MRKNARLDNKLKVKISKLKMTVKNVKLYN
jgi:hypothetical protein